MIQLEMWWLPTGWHRMKPPAAYRAVIAAADPTVDYGAQGYEDTLQFGRVSPKVIVRTGPGHLFVQIWGYDVEIGRFFVATEHAAAFVTDKLPGLVAVFGPLKREPE